MADMSEQRERMVERQIARRGVRDRRVLDAMRRVPREAFVLDGLEEFAYDDTPLPIGEGQTISQPYIVALMIEAAEVEPGERVLDVGTGSGYAAAVLAEIAEAVHTIERHERLAAAAERRFRALGYDNVSVRQGDGTVGWPEAAPFDAILVAAGGPAVPDALCRQLAVGGRLVIPVGPERHQKLLRILRLGEDEFEEEDLGDVAFVPLIGEQGWPSEETARRRPDDEPARGAAEPVWKVTKAPARKSAPALIREAAEPLPDIDDPAFGKLVDRFAEARVVLLGEASHGTSEFYRARARLTQRLIEEHGFTIVAVEADWPDAAAIDRHVRDRPAATAPERPFQRFPTWMWRNTDVAFFVDWLRERNLRIAAPGRRAGFYGLDLYSLNTSIGAVIDYLDKVDPITAKVARERYGCLSPWQKDPVTYGRAALTEGYAICEEKVLAMLRELLEKRLDYAAQDGESYLDAALNARLVAAAERYYRIMYYGSAESWNLRDRHMFETLELVLGARGEQAKAVVWAHNSHIGNAAATEMGLSRGEFNIGQLCRERFGEAAALIGFGTDRGTVAAATDWGGAMEVKTVRPSRSDSYERLCVDSERDRFFLDLRPGRHEALRYELLGPRLERAIGVIYRPESERWSHYFEASLPQQFDAYLWFEETQAVTPIGPEERKGLPDTYPFGV